MKPLHRAPTHRLHLVALLAFALAACQGAAPQEVGPASAVIISPADGAQFLVNESITVTTQVSHPTGAQRVALFANGQAVRLDALSTPLQSGRMLQAWIPPGPGAYELQVLLDSDAGDQAASETITIIVGDEYDPDSILVVPEIVASPTITYTPLPTDTPTPTLTPTPGAAMVTGDTNSNCRLGPSTAYQNVGTLFEGDTVPALGRLADNSYWLIRPDGAGANCWVWDNLVTVSGYIDSVPIVSPPPTPTFTPSPLPAPNQTAPTGNITCASLQNVDFVWQSVSGSVAEYRYQLQQGTSASGPFSDYKSGSTASTSAQEEVICGASNYYRWRVRAEATDGTNGAWSGWIVFRAGP